MMDNRNKFLVASSQDLLLATKQLRVPLPPAGGVEEFNGSVESFFGYIKGAQPSKIQELGPFFDALIPSQKHEAFETLAGLFMREKEYFPGSRFDEKRGSLDDMASWFIRQGCTGRAALDLAIIARDNESWAVLDEIVKCSVGGGLVGERGHASSSEKSACDKFLNARLLEITQRALGEVRHSCEKGARLKSIAKSLAFHGTSSMSSISHKMILAKSKNAKQMGFAISATKHNKDYFSKTLSIGKGAAEPTTSLFSAICASIISRKKSRKKSKAENKSLLRSRLQVWSELNSLAQKNKDRLSDEDRVLFCILTLDTDFYFGAGAHGDRCASVLASTLGGATLVNKIKLCVDAGRDIEAGVSRPSLVTGAILDKAWNVIIPGLRAFPASVNSEKVECRAVKGAEMVDVGRELAKALSLNYKVAKRVSLIGHIIRQQPVEEWAPYFVKSFIKHAAGPSGSQRITMMAKDWWKPASIKEYLKYLKKMTREDQDIFAENLMSNRRYSRAFGAKITKAKRDNEIETRTTGKAVKNKKLSTATKRGRRL